MILGMRYVYRNEESGEGGSESGGSGESQNEQQTSQNAEVEDKARKMGWTPKEEFKGDPDKWRDAAEFVERGENMVPLLRSQVKRQDKEIGELKKTLTEFAEFHTKVEQKAFERAFKELKARQIEAVSKGDAEAFIQVDQEMAALHKEASEAPKIKAPTNDGAHPDYQDWIARNRWAETDRDLAAEAEAQAQYLRARGDKREGADFLDAVKERVKKEFPDRFSNPRRNNAPPVEGASVSAKKGGKSYADLPADAKAACDRFVKNTGGKLTREAYVKQYFEGE